MKKLLTVALILIIASNVKAQDVIYKNDKSTVKAKVLEVEEAFIKYKKWENQTGPTYSISKNDVFMIIYQNGVKEVIETQTTVSPKVNNNESSDLNSSSNIETKPSKRVSENDGNFTFLPRNKTKPKSKANRGDILNNIGVTVNSIGKQTIPTIVLGYDFMVANNIAGSMMYTTLYNSEKVETAFGKFESKVLASTIGFGANYYFNKLAKLNKLKYSLYAGPMLFLTLINTFSSSDFDQPGVSNTSTDGSATDFSAGLRLGGRYHFGKKVGLFAEVLIGEGDPAFNIGLSVLRIK